MLLCRTEWPEVYAEFQRPGLNALPGDEGRVRKNRTLRGEKRFDTKRFAHQWGRGPARRHAAVIRREAQAPPRV